MNKLLSVLIILYLIQSITSDCYKSSASSVSECSNSKTDDVYCCLVEFRTNKDATYKKVCVPVIKDDIKDGKFEETIGNIEGGNYTASSWSEEILENFRDYSSISEFDCKGKYFTENMMMITLVLIFILI
jgi:hypothetical protein